MTAPDWWWSGVLVSFAIFIGLLLLLTWVLLRWGEKQVDKLDADLHAIDESQRLFQEDMRRRMWGDDDEAQ